MFEALETPRLFLRNISEEDKDFLFGLFSDDSVNEFLFDAEPLTDLRGADEIIDFYTQAEPRSQHRWVVERKPDHVKMGTCGFHRWNRADNTVEVGYDLHKAFRGNGYMLEAMKAIISFATRKMKVGSITACIYFQNRRSISLVEKLGFKDTGGTKDEVFRGQAYLHRIYALDCRAP
jgi:[ribosomal protein S5]-alanine N-acetyltransferase